VKDANFVSKEQELFEAIGDVEVNYSPPPQPKAEPKPGQTDHIYATFEEAAKKLGELVLGLDANPPTKPQLYVSTPGIGKTRQALALSASRARKNDTTLLAQGSREMMWQTRDRLIHHHQKAVVLEGRHPGYTRHKMTATGAVMEEEVPANCYRYDKVELARAKGYPAHSFVCNKCWKFPHAKDKSGEKNGFNGSCPYYQRKWQACGFVSFPGLWKPVIVTTHHMVANIISDQGAMTPDWIIVDEDPTPALRDTIAWSQAELNREVDSDAHADFRLLLHEAMEVADKYRKQAEHPFGHDAAHDTSEGAVELRELLTAAKEYGRVCLHGKALVAILKRAADNRHMNLREVVVAAATTGTGVMRGEFITMTEDRFDRLPHYKEPELANEVRKVMEQAEQNIEKAYTVSIRYTDEHGWSIIYDRVRKLGYEGHLVILDAYGDERLIKQWVGCDVERHEVRCRIDKNVTVKRYPNVRTSRAAMDDINDRNVIYDKFVSPELQMLEKKKVLFYTQKRYADWLMARVADEPYEFGATAIKWWWQDRGDDNYRDYDALIVAGTPYPNILAERDFANALFAGEEPLNWERQGGCYVDERVQAHTQARREKELLQAIYRLRLARKFSKPQTVVIFSTMALPVELELPGAVEEIKDHAYDSWDWQTEAFFAEEVTAVIEKYGCWTDVFSAFVFMTDRFFSWLDNPDELACPLTYRQLVYRTSMMRNATKYRKFVENVIEKVLALDPHDCIYRGRRTRIWGDVTKAYELLDKIRCGTREPGADDEELVEETPFDQETVVATAAGAGAEIIPFPGQYDYVDDPYEVEPVGEDENYDSSLVPSPEDDW
jgi:hypothetical protein